MRAWVLVSVFAVIWISVTGSAKAQDAGDIAWVQIEAHSSLQTAQARAQLLAGDLEDLNGFALPGGWYGIALGPYTRADAQTVLRSYRRQGLIPRDAFLAQSTAYRSQFWPEGADVLQRGTITVPENTASVETEETDQTEDTAAADPVTEEPEETPAQARRSERELDGEGRRALQVALQWAGYYTAAIDGAFGPGTRRAMSDWQAANGYAVTGVLTTAQRAALLGQYNALLDGLDLQTVRDSTAGVSMLIPQGVVSFDAYDYPFARYTSPNDARTQVLLISQAGDRNTLFGLYDIMQTLEIVPLDGPRNRGNTSFTLTGQNSDIISHTEATLQDGVIKGFTLVWPTGDEARRTRLLDEMRGSFSRIEGVLDPSWSEGDTQAVDLVSGLQVRTPRLSRSGFYVDPAGRVVTTTEAVSGCGRVTLDEWTEARVTAQDSTLGVAILEPGTDLAPRAVAAFPATTPRLQTDIAVAGYSYGGVLGAPTLTFGALAALTDLSGLETKARLDLTALEGDVGGPVFDRTGAVLGMLLPVDANGSQQLPETVRFAAKSGAMSDFLAEHGIAASVQDRSEAMAPEDITAQARDMTVLVSCWD